MSLPPCARPPLTPFDRAGRRPEGPAEWGFGDAAEQVRVWRVRVCVREKCARVGPPRDGLCRGRHISVLFCCSYFSFRFFARLPVEAQASCRSLRAC